MITHSQCYSKIEEEALSDLRELRQLVFHLPNYKGDIEFQQQLFELVDQLQDLCPYSPCANLIRKLVARFGDAYFYYNQTGDLCFLTDFIKEASIAESEFAR